MKLYDTRLELTAIRSICESDRKTSSKLFAQLDTLYFHSDAAVEAISRIQALAKSETELPSYTELTLDPVITESSRAILKKHRTTVSSSKELRRLIKQLTKYKQARQLYFLSEDINDKLSQDKVDVDALLETANDTLLKAKQKVSEQQEIFHFGYKNSSAGIIKSLLDDSEPKLVPTGFHDFDRINGGFAHGSLVLLAGPTGTGKTSLALNLALNMAKVGRESVVYIPLEMQEDELTERMLANLAGVEIDKIKQKKLKKKERKKVVTAYKDFVGDLKEDNTRFSIYCPYEGVTMSDALWTVKPYNYKVIVVDYLGLLDGLDGEDQWKKMKEASRIGKIFAKNTGAIVVILAQLDDDKHSLRYSKGVLDDCNNSWTWIANDETRENKVMEIKQRKARNQEMFDFKLSYCDKRYRVFDYDDSNGPTDDTPDYIDKMN